MRRKVLNIYRSNLKRNTNDVEGAKRKILIYNKRFGVKYADGLDERPYIVTRFKPQDKIKRTCI
jgi:hypothetical protein